MICDNTGRNIDKIIIRESVHNGDVKYYIHIILHAKHKE